MWKKAQYLKKRKKLDAEKISRTHLDGAGPQVLLKHNSLESCKILPSPSLHPVLPEKWKKAARATTNSKSKNTKQLMLQRWAGYSWQPRTVSSLPLFLLWDDLTSYRIPRDMTINQQKQSIVSWTVHVHLHCSLLTDTQKVRVWSKNVAKRNLCKKNSGRVHFVPTACHSPCMGGIDAPIKCFRMAENVSPSASCLLCKTATCSLPDEINRIRTSQSYFFFFQWSDPIRISVEIWDF